MPEGRKNFIKNSSVCAWKEQRSTTLKENGQLKYLTQANVKLSAIRTTATTTHCLSKFLMVISSTQK